MFQTILEYALDVRLLIIVALLSLTAISFEVLLDAETSRSIGSPAPTLWHVVFLVLMFLVLLVATCMLAVGFFVHPYSIRIG